LLKIIKPDWVHQSDDVVLIPDAPPPPPPSVETEEPSEVVQSELDPQAILEQEKARAEALAEHLLDAARQECQDTLEQARKEAETLRTKAWQEGFEAGRAEAAGQAADAIAETHRLLGALKERQQAFFEDYRKEIGALSIDIARKILGDALETDPLAMVDLVRRAVASVRGATYIEVELSERLPALIDTLFREFASANGAIDITAVSTQPGSCILRTDEGVVDASVETQLKNLADIFGDTQPV
jgi:flagellar assembly protein FliH